MFDAWDIAAMVFFLAVLAVAAVCWFVPHVNRNNPLNRARRNINGRKKMASEWLRPKFLPEDWE